MATRKHALFTVIVEMLVIVSREIHLWEDEDDAFDRYAGEITNDEIISEIKNDNYEIVEAEVTECETEESDEKQDDLLGSSSN